ncbi:transglutaminase family protein [Pararhodobacter sp. CCB-MM2]|uniref:transglutaminase family protein n=1 Tax=Pararhodobacter sp. CCB-MM2 TaxID=1786003 RepID=UPI000832A9AA|nr:transglutaminase family protein [Pararhodobacter sp. CCB-MM2]
MIYDISLAIDYEYAAVSDRARTLMRLLPSDLSGEQRVLDTALTITPRPDERREERDFFGNCTTTAVWHGPIDALHLVLKLRVERLTPPGSADLSPLLADLPSTLDGVRDLGPCAPHHFRGPSARVPLIPAISRFAQAVITKAGGTPTTRQAIELLGHALHEEMRFDAEATSVETGPEQAFEQRSGVCQDFAHIMIAGLRALGIPAGYVSGFLRTNPPPGQPRLEGVDAMHAWVCAWAGPVTGWIEFDPTNDQPAGQDYVTVARGRDYLDAAPVLGAMRSAGGQASRHAVDMVPLED